jgi:hypothetical protein
MSWSQRQPCSWLFLLKNSNILRTNYGPEPISSRDMTPPHPGLERTYSLLGSIIARIFDAKAEIWICHCTKVTLIISRSASSIRQRYVRGAERAPMRRPRATALRRLGHQAEVLRARCRPARLPSAIPSDCTLARSQIHDGSPPRSWCREAMREMALP